MILYSPFLFSFTLFLSVFLSSAPHAAMILVLLEILSLFMVSQVLLVNKEPNLNSFFVFIIFTIMASEATLGLALLVVCSRNFKGELESASF